MFRQILYYCITSRTQKKQFEKRLYQIFQKIRLLQFFELSPSRFESLVFLNQYFKDGGTAQSVERRNSNEKIGSTADVAARLCVLGKDT